MIKRLTEQNFIDEMGDKKFSIYALKALYAQYEELDPDMELDVIRIECEWTEYDLDDIELQIDYGYILDYSMWCQEHAEEIEGLEYNDIRRIYYQDLLKEMDSIGTLYVSKESVLVNE